MKEGQFYSMGVTKVQGWVYHPIEDGSTFPWTLLNTWTYIGVGMNSMVVCSFTFSGV